MSSKKQIEKSELFLSIEKILEDGIGEYYATMPPKLQRRFVEYGTKTTRVIEKLFLSKKNKIIQIAQHIKEWLDIIPHASPFYLEQEAKIKADKIMRLKNNK